MKPKNQLGDYTGLLSEMNAHYTALKLAQAGECSYDAAFGQAMAAVNEQRVRCGVPPHVPQCTFPDEPSSRSPDADA